MNHMKKPQRPGWGQNQTQGSVNSNFHCTQKKRQTQPVYSNTGKVVGYVTNGELIKRIRTELFLRKPPAIAFDIAVI